MRIHLHIGPDAGHSKQIQTLLSRRRRALIRKGVLFARSPGERNHTRLFMAVSDPLRPDTLRYSRGFASVEAQLALRAGLFDKLRAEVEHFAPEHLILSAHHLGHGLDAASQLHSLRDLLAPLSDDIRIIAFVDDPARMLTRHYAGQVLEGRAVSLQAELDCLDAPDFWQAALETRPMHDPERGLISQVQGACFWLDYQRLQHEWEDVFGSGSLAFHAIGPAGLAQGDLGAAFALDGPINNEIPEPLDPGPSAAWLTRCRMFNQVLLRYLEKTRQSLPRAFWRRLLSEMKLHGPPLAAGDFAAISSHFSKDINLLCQSHKGLCKARMTPDPPLLAWQEAPPERGFRATQYLLAMRSRINSRIKQATPAEQDTPPAIAEEPGVRTLDFDPLVDPFLSRSAQEFLPVQARQEVLVMPGSKYAPHDNIGTIDESRPGPCYFSRKPRRSGALIIACMKREAPYILEWLAYHRAIGVENFLIYSNDSEDGTVQMLDRLHKMGIITHRRNDGWTGNSPQTHALALAADEPLLQEARWVAHIDVDEFINIRCGNGTLEDLFARVPQAHQIAMTWRLFGNNGVMGISGDFVTREFAACAPKYCPKPHTAWGFKTLFRNNGAYARLSCHRPTALVEGKEALINWVNGSGEDVTSTLSERGWRSTRKTIGYDLVQLNHYALRSLDAFLIKRERGRALHMARRVGLAYWVRSDWNLCRDLTIRRNHPRMLMEYERFQADRILARYHAQGFDWHRGRAAYLRSLPTYETLYRQVADLRLNAYERIALTGVQGKES